MSKNPSSVKGYVTLPFIYKLHKDHRTAIAELVAKHGQNFALRGLFNNLHFFTDPKFVERVLYSNNLNYPRAPNPLFDRLDNPTGRLTRQAIRDRWRKCKSNILLPAFTESSVKKYTGIIVNETREHLAKWEEAYGDGNTVLTPYPLVQQLAVRNLQKGLLGNIDIDLDHLIRTIDEFATIELKYEMSITKLPWLFPTDMMRRTKAVMKDLDGIHDKILKYCLSEECPVTVFKEMARDYKAQYKAEENDEDLNTFLHNIAGMYTIASFDSLSHAMPITFAYLSMFPDVADKIREEIKTVVGDGEITAENIDALTYTKAAFLESMRYSGGIFRLLIRKAYEDDNIDGYEVKKGDRVIIPVHYMAHLSEYWENPEGFDPKRFFSIDTLSERYRYVHVTFGAGLTGCVGRHFAVLQCTVIMAMTLRKYRLDLLPCGKIYLDEPQRIQMTMHKLTS